MGTMKLGNRSLREIAVADAYEEARDLVDRLARDSFPIERLAIVGRGTQLVELIVGRWNAWRAVLTGAAGTALLGGSFALLFGMLLEPNGIALLSYVLYFSLVGAVMGAFFGALSYSLSSHHRRFASAAAMVATSYALMADESVADDALQRLRRMLSGTAPTAPQPVAAAAFADGRQVRQQH